MGIDWYRFSLRSGRDRAKLEGLIEQQAIAFQSMWGWHSDSHPDLIFRKLLEELHHQTYQKTSVELSDFLAFPEWDDERCCPQDIPNLDPCWRVSPIANAAIFPPVWRMSAYRTYLPERLKMQLEQWETWIEEVRRGEHEDYLRELQLYDAIDFMKYHWSCLRENAIASLDQTANWAKQPKLIEVRDRILPLPEPGLQVRRLKINLAPHQRKPEKQDGFDLIYREVFDEIKTLIDLTHAWDSNVRDRWKVRYYERSYCLDFNEFIGLAFDDGLQQFFQWANRCVGLGFGLYLDY